MFHKLISSLSFFLVVITATAAGQVKVAYMNPQEVISQAPEREQIETRMNEFIEEKRDEFQQRTRAFQDSVAAYQENAETMSQSQRERREEQLVRMEQELNEHQQRIQQQIQQRRNELLQPLYERMDKAIAAIAEEMDLDFVLNEATGNGEEVIFYSSDQKLNITQQVINRIQN